MICDLRTYDVRPHATPEVERLFAEAYPERSRHSRLAGSWHSEIGHLNRIVQLWPHESVAGLESVMRSAKWPPSSGDLIVSERSEVFVPFDISPPLIAQDVGPFFEIRRYVFADGDLPKVIAAWEAALPGRLEFGPLVVVMHSEPTSTLVHIWPYKSLDSRMELRRKARETGLWPPLAYARKHGMPLYRLVSMENSIMLPSDCSPLR
jgi:hypothetical protein